MESTLNIFWNVFRFPLPYMDLDGYDPADASLDDGELTVVDEWVLSRLQSVEAEAHEALGEFRISDGLNAVLSFLTEDVSRFYVKAIRERMWEEADSDSKRGAYATLSTVLDESIRLLAPFTPYLTERMYQILDGEATSVHALSYPEADADLRDADLERRMSVLRDVEEAAANARQQGGRKLRWPVQRVIVASDDETVADGVESLSDLLAERVNARSVEVVAEFDELVERAVPEMSVIGPEFGADAQRVMDAVEGKTRAEVEGGVDVDGETHELTDEMVSYEAEPPEHVSAAEFEGGTVYVDTELTDDIEAEGYARDVVRRIQEMRKRLDLDVESEIDTAVDVADERVAEFVDRHRDYVASETRSREYTDEKPAEGGWELVEEWDVEGVAVTIGVDPVDA
jgi:isoleucyl-tRNA synthetase